VLSLALDRSVFPEQQGLLEAEIVGDVIPRRTTIIRQWRRRREHEPEIQNSVRYVEKRAVQSHVAAEWSRVTSNVAVSRRRLFTRRRLLFVLGVVAGRSGRRRSRHRGRGERGGGLHVLGRGGRGARQLVRELGEVEVRGAALDGDGRDVVRARGHLRVVERAEPDAGLLARLADLGHPLAPGPHPHAAVRRVLEVPARPLPAGNAARVVAGVRRRRVQGAGVAAAGAPIRHLMRQRRHLLYLHLMT
jgi:hypothetical protein